MKKLSLFLALLAAMMLPVTAQAKPDSKPAKQSKEKSQKSNKTKTPEPQKTEDNSDGVTFSDELIILNNEAAYAFQLGEYSKAEKIYEAMNTIGETNVTWYHLGRVYAAQNKCKEAYDAYHRVATAPKLNPKDLPPEVLLETTQSAITDLDALCSTKLVFKCEPEDIILNIDGSKEFKCSNEPVSVVPGKHTINGKTDDGFISQDITVAEGQTEEVRMSIQNFDVYPVMNQSAEILEHKSSSFKIAGYSLLGAGFLGMIVSSGFMGYYASQDNRDDDKLKYTYAFFGVSGAIAVTGAILLIINASYYQTLLDNLKDEAKADDKLFTIDFAPVVSPSFSGFTLNGRF